MVSTIVVHVVGMGYNAKNGFQTANFVYTGMTNLFIGARFPLYNLRM